MKTIAKVVCGCKHVQQDQMYGPNVRVANKTSKVYLDKDKHDVRCTVCNTLHTVNTAQLK